MLTICMSFFVFYFFFLINIGTNIITNIIAIIARTPVQPKIETILLPKDIITPANRTPKVTTAWLGVFPEKT